MLVLHMKRKEGLVPLIAYSESSVNFKPRLTAVRGGDPTHRHEGVYVMSIHFNHIASGSSKR